MNMSPSNKAHFESEKEAINLILTGIGDEIYSTIDASQTAQEMWKAIERLQQGESLNIQDPEWSRFVTIVKQQHKLDEVSYHKLFDILKQYQKEVNELRADRLARNANPLALDKDMQKNLAFIAKYFKKIYKHTNNNTRTSSNSRNKNVDTTPRYKNDNQSGQFRNQRTMNVVGVRENVGSPVVQQSGIQCFNCKEFDSAYHKEKMLLCKQAEKDKDEEIDEQKLEAHYSYMEKIHEVPTADTCTDSEPLEKVQNDTGYNVFANDLQHSKKSESISNTCLVETDDSNVILDSLDMCDDDIQNNQNDVESNDECVALANLIANLKLDVDENKKETDTQEKDKKQGKKRQNQTQSGKDQKRQSHSKPKVKNQIPRRVVPRNYNPKGTRFLIASRFPTPPLASSPVIVEPLRIELPFLEDHFQEDPPPEVLMDDNRTMAELLQAPTEGYEDAI
nr:Gag-Pol polyprotein [Tanacetum cinerariifolium]